MQANQHQDEQLEARLHRLQIEELEKPWHRRPSVIISIVSAVLAVAALFAQGYVMRYETAAAKLDKDRAIQERKEAEKLKQESLREVDALRKSKGQLETDNATLTKTANDLRLQIETDTAKFKELQAALTATVVKLESENKHLINKLQLAALDGLRAKAVLKAVELISLAKAKGIELKVISGYRTLEQQQRMYQEGKTRIPVSTHNTGLAFDVAVVKDGQIEWQVSDELKRVGELGKGLGLRWGGDYKPLKDWFHFETPDAREAQRALTSKSPD